MCGTPVRLVAFQILRVFGCTCVKPLHEGHTLEAAMELGDSERMHTRMHSVDHRSSEESATLH